MDKRVYVFTNLNGTPETTTQGQGEGVPQVPRLNRKQRRRALAILAAERRKNEKLQKAQAATPSPPPVSPTGRLLDYEPPKERQPLTPEEKELLREEIATLGWTSTTSGRIPSSRREGGGDEDGGRDG